MRRWLAVGSLVAVVFACAPVMCAQTTDVIPGTQIRLKLVTGLSTSVAHDGDPFTAVVDEPVFAGNQLVLPAGSKIHGTIRSVERPKFFAMFRGGAAMNLNFNSVEVESRIFPARMSILGIYNGSTESGKKRKDVKTVEGVVIEEKHDIKSDVEDVAIGGSGGSVVGLIFSHVIRGTVIGLVGGGAYVVARKGKDVELPADTGMVVRMDSTVSLPGGLVRNAAFTTSGQ